MAPMRTPSLAGTMLEIRLKMAHLEIRQPLPVSGGYPFRFPLMVTRHRNQMMMTIMDLSVSPPVTRNQLRHFSRPRHPLPVLDRNPYPLPSETRHPPAPPVISAHTHGTPHAACPPPILVPAPRYVSV